jgi:predicted transglutaminase-like cysteine proteinase
VEPRQKSVTALILSISFCALSCDSSARDANPALEALYNSAPASDQASTLPPARFFSINAVLTETDRLRGRGPGAIRLAALTASQVLTDSPTALENSPASGQEPFGFSTFRLPDGMLWRKWQGVEADIARERIILDRCRATPKNCPPHAAQFLRLVDTVALKSGQAQLDEANRGINAAIGYVSDLSQHGEADRWSAPLATFATGKGDCEDYAIAKYVALGEAGFPRDKLRLVLVRDRAVGHDHAVLAARLDGRWRVLDNKRAELIEDTEASSFTPLFSIDNQGVQIFAAPYAGPELPRGDGVTAPSTNATADKGSPDATTR